MSDSGRESVPHDIEPLPGANSGLHAELSGRREVPELFDPRAELGEVPDWMGRGAWVLSGALASALVFALIIWEPDRYAQHASETSIELPDEGEEPTMAGAIAPTIVGLAEARVVSASAVERGGEPLAAGAAVHENDVLALAPAGCVRVEPDIRVCAVEPSVIHVASLARRARVIEVERGTVVSWPRSGARVVLRHEGLRASADEAAFGMAVRQGGQVDVWAARGRVDVTRQPDSADIHGGEGLRWTEAAGLAPYAPSMAQFRAPWLARKASERPRAKRASPGAAQADPGAGEDGLVDAELAELGLPPGAELTDLALLAEDPESVLGGAAADGDTQAASTTAAAEAQLAEAKAALEADQVAEAQAGFGAVIAEFPGTPAARRASVLLGDLRLRKLDDAMGALGAYRTFVGDASSGELDARARLGAIAALKRLNRYAHERKAIEDFLQRYPGSGEVPKLKARRRLLGGS